MKKFEVTIEVIEQYTVAVRAESFDDAQVRSEDIGRDELRERLPDDCERRVVRVSRDLDSRMYR